MSRRIGLSLIAALSVIAAVDAARQAERAPQGRFTIVMSDLHMGVGRDGSGAWHPYEDFRWERELSAFLDALNQEDRGATDLILNGDTFELLQALDQSCPYSTAGAGCSEAEALARIERVLTAHKPEIKAFADFARFGSNRLIVVPGDHDAALLFPSVRRRVLDAFGTAKARVHVAESGYWLSSDGKIYVEHGHQLDLSPNKLANWPLPFVRRAGRQYLARSWGEEAIQTFYNRYEQMYPVLDNVAEEGVGVKFGLAAEHVADAGQTAPSLLRYFLLKLSWPQFRQDLDGGDSQPPQWDLAKVRAQGPSFLVASLPGDDRIKPLATAALTDGRLTTSMNELTDDEIVAICDYRAAVRRSRRRMETAITQLSPSGPSVVECPRLSTTVGSEFEYYWRSRDAVIARRLAAVQKQLAHGGGPIALFVYGHTHLPTAMFGQAGIVDRANPGDMYIPFGFAVIRNVPTPVAINDGAWQRTITPNQLDALKRVGNVSDEELLRSVRLEQLAPCYSFVQIAPYEGVPAGRTLFWRQADNATGDVATNCARRAPIEPE